ncbi:MAG: PQQ-binding-like beta-propeller repeat protein [Propionibacteriaceae bacterium]|nr:PQQ-binding-like beta-propeller repeat protein [Propionibacteriaceae bacterium]
MWRPPLSDLTRVPPVLAGADTAVVVTLDGAVTGYDLVTGSERWRTGMGTEIRHAPLVAGDRILVADAAGALSCFDLAGKELWTIDAGRVSALAVGEGPDPLVAVGRSDSMVVRAYSLADGSQVWHRRVLEDAKDLVSLGDRFVLRDDDQLVGLDAATGAQLWTAAIRSQQAIGGGDRVLLLSASSLVLVDREGRQVREWPHRLGDVGRADNYLETSGDAVIVAGPIGFAVGRLP